MSLEESQYWHRRGLEAGRAEGAEITAELLAACQAALEELYDSEEYKCVGATDAIQKCRAAIARAEAAQEAE